MSQSLGEALPEAIAKVSEWIGQQGWRRLEGRTRASVACGERTDRMRRGQRQGAAIPSQTAVEPGWRGVVP